MNDSGQNFSIYPPALAPAIRAEVEHQLLDDLRHYGIDITELTLDWSGGVGEGHGIFYRDGYIESCSGVAVVNESGEVVAEGWIDFVHARGADHIFLFWDSLDAILDDKWITLKRDFGIPLHIWERVPDASKNSFAQCAEDGATWCHDPLVRKWCRERRKSLQHRM